MNWVYQPLLPAAAQLQSGGGALTLTAASGSFALSGQDATLSASRSFLAAQGSFALSGQSVDLLRGALLTAARGSFALSGQSVDLLRGALLTAARGSFALSGQDATLSASGPFVAARGAFVLSGQAAALTLSSASVPAPTTPLAVQRGILRVVRSAVVPLGAGVFDHVPHSRSFPFVGMDQHQVLENDGAAILGFTHIFYLSVWSDYRGSKEVWEILSKMWVALHERRLVLENGAHVLCRVSEQNADTDADGLTYMGRLTARIVTNPFEGL